MTPPLVVLAGATGNLGGRIAASLRRRGARVRALVRADSDPAAVRAIRAEGVEVATVRYDDLGALAEACAGASCVVSALAGLRDVVVDAQSMLLAGAVAVGVPRFIPSDYCVDYRALPPGRNRNLDLRREFAGRVDRAPVAATTVFCGMFADLLHGPAPFVLRKPRRVLAWGDADQPMDFTTVQDAAEFTAAAALDDRAPRWLCIAGDVQSARGLAAAASDAYGERYRVFRPGGLGAFRALIRVARTVAPGADELYPPWQGMQYMHDMFEGRAKLAPLDNDRYPGIAWTSVRDVLAGAIPDAGR